jgi:hypothetical protein
MMDHETIIRLARQAAQGDLSIAVFTVDELARFADLVYKEKTSHPHADRGVMEFLYTVNDVELTCHLDYEAEQPSSFFEPGYPESVVLESAYHRGENIAHLLCDSVIQEIEDAALEQIKENHANC